MNANSMKLPVLLNNFYFKLVVLPRIVFGFLSINSEFFVLIPAIIYVCVCRERQYVCVAAAWLLGANFY